MIGSDGTFTLDSPLNTSLSKSSETANYGQKFDSSKKTLVLDLDQTLVFLTTKRPSKDVNYVEVLSQGDVSSFVIKRPGLEAFMRDMSSLFNICIYTSTKPSYSKEAVKAIGLIPYIFEIFARPHCTKVSKGVYMKSLMRLGFPLQDTIFIDNSPNQIRSQPLNSILIQSFRGDTGDSALILLQQFLQSMAAESDVRPVTDKLFAYFEKQSNQTTSTRRNSKALSAKEKSVTLPEIREERDEEDKFSKLGSPKKRPATTGSENLDNDKFANFQMIYHKQNDVSLGEPKSIDNTERPQDISFSISKI